MKRRIARIYTVAVLLVSAATASFVYGDTVQTVDVLEGPLAETIHEGLTTQQTENGFNGAVIVERHGRVVLSAGYGLANREESIAFTSQTVAQIGSITKPFVASLAILLMEDDTLDFRVPISTYLPEAPAPGSDMTLHQLMSHTSGLVEYCGEGDFVPYTLDQLISDCLSQPLAYEPESEMRYSNAGYSVVAAVIERATGERLEDLLRDRLLAPAGLLHTGYVVDGDAAVARGYRDGLSYDPVTAYINAIAPDYWSLKGNGGMQSTAEDMHRWSQVLRGQGELSGIVQIMHRMPLHQISETSWIGFGWFLSVAEDGTVTELAHTGSDGVFFSHFMMDPETDTFFYIVGNAGEETGLNAGRVVFEALRADEGETVPY